MKSYLGTKAILAQPMTLGEYNSYRGWDMPENEEPETPGYFIEYTDGGKPNHPDHKGYISWSPADVFERSYKPSDTFQARLIIERDELSDKLGKLDAFLLTDAKLNLSDRAQQLLNEQSSVMHDYLGILNERIAEVANV